MKSFIEKIFEWKTATCFMFTGSIIVYALIALFIGETQVSIATLALLLIISALGTLLQYLFFTQALLKKTNYITRLALFSLCFFIFLSACAYIFKWMPMNFGSWVLFGIIFLIVLFGITIGFEVYFRITGKKYDGVLGQYKKSREEKDKQ